MSDRLGPGFGQAAGRSRALAACAADAMCQQRGRCQLRWGTRAKVLTRSDLHALLLISLPHPPRYTSTMAQMPILALE